MCCASRNQVCAMARVELSFQRLSSHHLHERKQNTPIVENIWRGYVHQLYANFDLKAQLCVPAS
eukprot:5101989-Amphidinium_carterae.1